MRVARKRSRTLRHPLCSALFAASLGATVLPGQAAKLGGAYFIDDSEIGSLYSCEIENWASFAANRDRVFVFSPACVFNLGRPTELGVTAVRTRSSGEWGTVLSATAKTEIAKQQGSAPAIGIAGAVAYNALTGRLDSVILNVPFTWDLSKTLRFNINAGSIYDASEHHLLATGGAGLSWNFVPNWSVIGEMFAIVGPAQTNPRWQSGIRYNPSKDVDCDVIYGRNITGERSHWITLALTVRLWDK